MQGYLEKKSESWFGGWTEKYCVLTNVGLLFYDDPQKRPRHLFPCIDAQLIPMKEQTYNKKYVFRIQCFNENVIFAARTKEDFDRWKAAIEKLNRETD